MRFFFPYLHAICQDPRFQPSPHQAHNSILLDYVSESFLVCQRDCASLFRSLQNPDRVGDAVRNDRRCEAYRGIANVFAILEIVLWEIGVQIVVSEEPGVVA